MDTKTTQEETMQAQDTIEVFYNGRWHKVLDYRPGMIFIGSNGGHWVVAAGMEVRNA